MKRWIRDVIYAAVFLVMAIVLWVEAGTFTQNLINIPLAMPTTYGRLWAAILGILAFIQLIRALINRPEEKLPKIFTPIVIVSLISLILYVATVRYMGFLIDTTILLSIMLISFCCAMGKLDVKNKKKLVLQVLICCAVSFLAAYLIRYIFVKLLKAKLPKGKLISS